MQPGGGSEDRQMAFSAPIFRSIDWRNLTRMQADARGEEVRDDSQGGLNTFKREMLR